MRCILCGSDLVDDDLYFNMCSSCYEQGKDEDLSEEDEEILFTFRRELHEQI